MDRSLKPGKAPLYQRYAKLMGWADRIRRLRAEKNRRVRTTLRLPAGENPRARRVFTKARPLR